MLSLQVSLYIKISLFFPLSFGAMHLTSLHFGFLPTFGCYAATIQWHCTSRVAAKTSVASIVGFIWKVRSTETSPLG